MMSTEYATMKQQSFVCKHCGWRGMGSELTYGEYHPETNIAGVLERPTKRSPSAISLGSTKHTKKYLERNSTGSASAGLEALCPFVNINHQ